MRNCFRGWLLVVFAFMGAMQVRGHVVELIYMEVDTDARGEWTARVFFDAGYALPEMRANAEAPQPKREWLVNQNEQEWQRLREGAEKYLAGCLRFTGNDSDLATNIPWKTTFPDFDKSPPDFPVRLDGCAYFWVVISGRLDSGSLRLRVNEGEVPSFTVAHGGALDVVSPGNFLLLVKRDQESGESVLAESGWWQQLAGFFRLGFTHVLPAGADHVLFILALFFFSSQLKQLLYQSLMFTVAHSLTLMLSLIGVVRFSPEWIEPLIALSIAWIAFENVFFAGKTSKYRLATVSVFGLIHGMGFASSLRDGLGAGDGWVLPLVAANVGIECAQVAVLTACFVCLCWFVEKKWYRPFCHGCSILIGLTGLWWFVTRLG